MIEPSVIVRPVAKDSEGTIHCMLLWSHSKGKLEHISNLEIDSVDGATYFHKNMFGRAYVPLSVFENLRVEGESNEDRIEQLSVLIQETYMSYREEIEIGMNNNNTLSADIDLNDARWEQLKAA